MKPNRIQLSVIVLCLALFIPACSKEENASTSANGAAPKKKFKLAFVSNNAAAFWTIARTGCNDAAKAAGDFEVAFKIPSAPSAAEQQRVLDDLLAAGIDGIAVSPVDPANETEELNKVAGRALLITVDSDAPTSKRTCYIGTDNVAAGTAAGKLIKEAIPQGGKIMFFVGNMDAQNARDRFKGITNELAGSSFTVLDVRTDGADTLQAQRNAEDTLVKNPDVACLVGLYSYNGPAILNAVRAAGKAGKVQIVCFDEDAATLKGVADGDIFGTVVQQPYEFGRQAMNKMAASLRGDKNVFPDSGKQIIPTINIKKDNVADFQAKLKQMLGN